MAKSSVVTATFEHAHFIGNNLRKGDREEILATFDDPYKCVVSSYDISTLCWTLMLDDKPCAIFGVSPISVLGGVGAPWLLGTDDAHRVKKRYLKDSESYLNEMMEIYPTLMNYVDIRNTVSIRWLKWLRFQFGPAVALGRNGEMFFPFTLRKNYV